MHKINLFKIHFRGLIEHVMTKRVSCIVYTFLSIDSVIIHIHVLKGLVKSSLIFCIYVWTVSTKRFWRWFLFKISMHFMAAAEHSLLLCYIKICCIVHVVLMKKVKNMNSNTGWYNEIWSKRQLLIQNNVRYVFWASTRSQVKFTLAS